MRKLSRSGVLPLGYEGRAAARSFAAAAPASAASPAAAVKMLQQLFAPGVVIAGFAPAKWTAFSQACRGLLAARLNSAAAATGADSAAAGFARRSSRRF